MIVRAYMAVCDACYTEAEAFSPEHINHKEYVEMLRRLGWRVKRTSTICPDCLEEAMLG